MANTTPLFEDVISMDADGNETPLRFSRRMAAQEIVDAYGGQRRGLTSRAVSWSFVPQYEERIIFDEKSMSFFDTWVQTNTPLEHAEAQLGISIARWQPNFGEPQSIDTEGLRICTENIEFTPDEKPLVVADPETVLSEAWNFSGPSDLKIGLEESFRSQSIANIGICTAVLEALSLQRSIVQNCRAYRSQHLRELTDLEIRAQEKVVKERLPAVDMAKVTKSLKEERDLELQKYKRLYMLAKHVLSRSYAVLTMQGKVFLLSMDGELRRMYDWENFEAFGYENVGHSRNRTNRAVNMLQDLCDNDGWGCPEELLKFFCGHTSHTIMRAACQAFDVVLERKYITGSEDDYDVWESSRRIGKEYGLLKNGDISKDKKRDREALWKVRKMYNRFVRLLEQPECAFISDDIPVMYIRRLYRQVDNLRSSWDKKLAQMAHDDMMYIFRLRELRKYPDHFGGYQATFKHIVRMTPLGGEKPDWIRDIDSSHIPTLTINRAEGKGALGAKYAAKKAATKAAVRQRYATRQQLAA